MRGLRGLGETEPHPFSEQMAGGEAGKAECPLRASRAWSPPAAPAHPHARPLETLLRRLGATDAQQEDKFASILSAAGTFGTFQRRLVALTFIPNILSAFFLFPDQYTLTAQKPYCNTSWILAVGPDLSEAEQMNLTLPRAPDGSFLTCLMYLPVPWDLASIIQFGLNHTGSCQDGWIYPHSKKRSLINEVRLAPAGTQSQSGEGTCGGRSQGTTPGRVLWPP